jgi:hypothetical protein
MLVDLMPAWAGGGEAEIKRTVHSAANAQLGEGPDGLFVRKPLYPSF